MGARHCTSANILLVEARSAYTSDLDAALDYARKAAGVVVVSNSWGGSEYSGESSEDVHFTTPSGHQGVTFTVAAGDSGAPAEYPSSSPDVLSVGGSTLRLTSSGAYSSESVWSGGGGGSSRYEGLPSYQAGLGVTNRGTPDVSYDANPSTGFAVYDSYGSGGWAQFGGTSAGAPQWAALIAIADQGRALAGKGSLANAQAALYSLPRSDFHDITSGSNGSSATTGYDVASGLGSPIASSVIRDLVAFNGSTNFTQAAATGGTVRQRGWGNFTGSNGSGRTDSGGSGFSGWGFGGFNFGGFFFGFDVAAGGGSAAAGGPAAAIAAPGTGRRFAGIIHHERRDTVRSLPQTIASKYPSHRMAHRALLILRTLPRQVDSTCPIPPHRALPACALANGCMSKVHRPLKSPRWTAISKICCSTRKVSIRFRSANFSHRREHARTFLVFAP